jgi:hypothetical protein
MVEETGAWEWLSFSEEGRWDVTRQFRVVSRKGQPLLLIPQRRKAAAHTFGLYPAQTRRARWARTLLRFLVSWGLPTGLKTVRLQLSTADPFMQYLAEESGDVVRALPELGVLAGNAATAGRRFVVLVFEQGRRPVAAVKAGLSGRARDLVRQERNLLQQASAGTAGLPRFRSEFEDARLSALATDYYPGDSPAGPAFDQVASLLEAWLEPSQSVALGETTPWRDLCAAAAGDPLFAVISRALSGRPVPRTLFHGDFAPWNVKVDGEGRWTVLDWERGQLAGVPGWDWFHFALQPAILVERLGVSALVDRTERLLRSYLFRQYATKAGVLPKEREFLLGYLLYCVWVLKPTEGLEITRQLLEALAEAWRPAQASS